MNKIALITGGSRGLGRNTAIALAKRQVDVIITYHSKKTEAENTVAEAKKLGVNAAALQLDVCAFAEYPTFFDALGNVLKAQFNSDKLDYLVNNAGTGIDAPFAQTTMQQFDSMVNIHLKSVFFITQGLLPTLRDGGRIVNISSGLARFSLPGKAAYSMMKGGVEVLTRYLAKELGERQIAVNTIAPGAIATDFGGGVVRDNPQVNKGIASVTALGRVGEPDDIGGAIALLLADENRWITGQRIEVSGGMFL